MYKTTTETLHCIRCVCGFLPESADWQRKRKNRSQQQSEHREFVFKGAAGLSCQTVVADPTVVCPATSIQRALLITLQTLLARSVPVALCTSCRSGTSGQTIPDKRHGIPNTGRSSVPVLSSVAHWNKAGREEEKDLSTHAGGAPSGLFLQRGQVASTLCCQTTALRIYPGIIPPPAQQGCVPRIGSSFYHAFSPLRTARAEAAPQALSQPALGRASSTSAGQGGEAFLLPGAGLGSIAPPAKVYLPGVFCLKD